MKKISRTTQLSIGMRVRLQEVGEDGWWAGRVVGIGHETNTYKLLVTSAFRVEAVGKEYPIDMDYIGNQTFIENEKLQLFGD